MTTGHPQTKQSRKTARRKSRQLQRMVASMVAETQAKHTGPPVTNTYTDVMSAILAGHGIRRI
jgi:hypothetical protein